MEKEDRATDNTAFVLKPSRRVRVGQLVSSATRRQAEAGNEVRLIPAARPWSSDPELCQAGGFKGRLKRKGRSCFSVVAHNCGKRMDVNRIASCSELPCTGDAHELAGAQPHAAWEVETGHLGSLSAEVSSEGRVMGGE